MGASQKLHQMENILNNSEKWVFSLKPIFTKSLENNDADHKEEEFCTTPPSAESRISSRLVCPPAPKKRKHASSKSCHYGGGRREFFNPPDLETIFIRREKGF